MAWPTTTTWQCVILLASLVTLSLLVSLTSGQCPWPRNPHHASLHSDCVCGYSNVRRLSVQCSPVANFSQLLEVLHAPSVQRLAIDLLYINNASGLTLLPKNAFKRLDIQQIHLANTRLETIERGAFAGLEDKLLSLTLQATGLREIPIAEFRTLRALRTLDLSQNRLRRIRSEAFSDLGQLATLRLASNPDLQLDHDAFVGLERSLKNLNLKSIGAKFIPEAIRNLTELAFLDLAQNKVEEIEPRKLSRLQSLTALSLERNFIRSLHPDTFLGLNESLSSLSLLNNLLVEFPQKALTNLAGLRVLDLGFNAIRALPPNAFKFNSLLTLLALDGNPLKSLPLASFRHLNATLRGISVGGKAFECDCKVRWLAEWAMEYSLQITSRERNPQFCSKPVHLRNKPFTQVDLNDFLCAPSGEVAASASPAYLPAVELPVSSTSTPTSTTTITTPTVTVMPQVHYEHTSITTRVASTSEQTIRKVPSSTKPSIVLRPSPSYVQVITVNEPIQSNMPTRPVTSPSSTSTTSTSTTEPPMKVVSVGKAVPVPLPLPGAPSQTTLLVHEGTVEQSEPSPSSVVAVSVPKTSSRPRLRSSNGGVRLGQPSVPISSSLRLLDVVYRNNSIWLRWEPLGKSSTQGYQVVYRYFGSEEYHRSEPIAAKATAYTLPHYIAPNERIFICVLNLDNSAETASQTTPLPSSQCKELTTREPVLKKATRPGGITASHKPTAISTNLASWMRINDIDKIVIAISVAVFLFIAVTVLVCSCCFYNSSSRKSKLRHFNTAHGKFSNKSLSPMTRSSLDHEWETVSVYSTRSIPRARISSQQQQQGYGNAPPIPPPAITGTIRSHISAGQPMHSQAAAAAPVTRYFGSTLPSKATNGGRHQWIDPSYPNGAYTHGIHPQAISYGTTVTANGGLVPAGSAYFPETGYIRNVSSSLARDHRSRHEKGSSSSSSNGAAHRSHHRNRKSSKNRLKSPSKMLAPPGVMSELRIHGVGGVGGGGGPGSGSSSYNRLLLSSSSNSFQSQNDYDSDHWNGGVRSIGGTTATSRMNDNEVDIYVDQNYVRRFI